MSKVYRLLKYKDNSRAEIDMAAADSHKTPVRMRAQQVLEHSEDEDESTARMRAQRG